jgi:Methyltransferase domain
VKRVTSAEWLDTDAGTAAEVDLSLGDLRRINRWFGGIATTRALVEHVALRLGTRSLSLLEVAAGSGDVTQAVREDLRRKHIQIKTVLLDRAYSHLRNGAPAVVSDALALPFSDASFDLVSCGLFAHHLSPDQLIQFVNDGLRVARVAVLVNDLVRSPAHLALVYAGLPLYRSRMTRHDSVASVRQAYTTGEMRELLGRTAAKRIEIRRCYLFRMGAVAWNVMAGA